MLIAKEKVMRVSWLHTINTLALAAACSSISIHAQNTAYVGTWYSVTLAPAAPAPPAAPLACTSGCVYKTTSKLPDGLTASSTNNGIVISGIPNMPTPAVPLNLYAIGSNEVLSYTINLTVAANTPAQAVAGNSVTLIPAFDGEPYEASINIAPAAGAMTCTPLTIAAASQATLNTAKISIDLTAGIVKSTAIAISGPITFQAACAAGGAPVNVSIPIPGAAGAPAGTVEINPSTLASLNAPSTPAPATPSINGTLITSSSSPTSAIQVRGEPGASLEIFQFNGDDAAAGCEAGITGGTGTQLQIAATGSAPVGSTQLGSTQGPYSITLSAPLKTGTKICLQQTVTPAGGAGQPTIQYSSAAPVEDADNPYPSLRTFYTAGAMINNENGSSNTSTGAEYVDIGFAFIPVPDSGKHIWNWASSISGRFSDIPVTAPSSTASASSATPSSSGTLNILSSQESVRVLGATAITLGASLKPDGYRFFSGPVVKAGIDTLLNPSATQGTGSATAVAQFAPVYTEFSGGLRTGYRHFNGTDDNSPQTIAQFDATIGKFSNLQSLVCNTKMTSTVTAQPTNTSCYAPQVAGASSYTLDQQSRITLLRPEVAGFINLGGSNFILGLDANLPQSVDAPKNLDLQNKAGGSVTIYFGYSGSLTGLFTSLKLPGSSQ
jgi:hypothetical protein